MKSPGQTAKIRTRANSLIAFVHNLTTDDRGQHLRLGHVLRQAGQHVAVDDDQVAELAGFRAALRLKAATGWRCQGRSRNGRARRGPCNGPVGEQSWAAGWNRTWPRPGAG